MSFLLSETPTVVKTERCGVCVRLRRRVCLGDRDKDRVRARVIEMMTIASLIFSGKLIHSIQILDYNAMYSQLTPKYMHICNKLIPNKYIFLGVTDAIEARGVCATLYPGYDEFLATGKNSKRE